MVCWKATWQITSTDSIPSKDMGMPFPQKLWHWYTIAKMFLQVLREHNMCYNIFNSQIMFRNYIPRLVKGIAYYYKCSILKDRLTVLDPKSHTMDDLEIVSVF